MTNKIGRNFDDDLIICEKASPGPWDFEPHGKDVALFAGPSELNGMCIHRLNILNCGADWDFNGENNRAFIAASRTGWPDAIQKIKDIESKLTAAKTALILAEQTINGLSDQQAMSDDWYEEALKEIRNVINDMNNT